MTVRNRLMFLASVSIVAAATAAFTQEPPRPLTGTPATLNRAPQTEEGPRGPRGTRPLNDVKGPQGPRPRHQVIGPRVPEVTRQGSLNAVGTLSGMYNIGGQQHRCPTCGQMHGGNPNANYNQLNTNAAQNNRNN